MFKFLLKKVSNNKMKSFIPSTPLYWVGQIEFWEFLYNVLKRLNYFQLHGPLVEE